MTTISSFLRDQSGATSIEYAILASCIAVVIVTAVNALGSKVAGSYTSVAVALK
jgi:pilus assembly protein Flp/PilA